MKHSLDFLSTKSGFNMALKHFKSVNNYIKQFKGNESLADLINNSIENKILSQHQISSILNALLIDKYGYYAKSFSIKNTNSKPIEITKFVIDWHFDLLLSYYHPQLGTIIINPKNEESWGGIDELKENELIVVYIGNFDNEFDPKIAEKCANAIEIAINGGTVKSIEEFKLKNTSISKNLNTQSVKKQVKSETKKKNVLFQVENSKLKTNRGKKKLSPRYGVFVSNELFHNGNVEAWKKIIRSYEMKYPHIEVLVFYENEQIHDINTLFKWGKVKHGTNIYFALLGTEFTDVSKLRRYLVQGASPRFEDFLRGDPTKSLTLF